jgi:hypothetical protein
MYPVIFAQLLKKYAEHIFLLKKGDRLLFTGVIKKAACPLFVTL